MATYKEATRKTDAYRKDSSPRGLNHRDKGTPAKKISTASQGAKDNQKMGKC